MKRIITLILFSLFTSSCTIETGGGGFRSSDEEYTKYLYQQLDQLKVNYSVDDEGFIRYTEEEKTGFIEAQKAVEHILNEGISTKPNNPDDQEYLISLLKSKNLEHYVLEKEDGNWVKWYPKDEEHQQKIMLQVVEYNFSKQMKGKSNCATPCK